MSRNCSNRATNLFTKVGIHSFTQVFKGRTKVGVKIPAPFHYSIPGIKE